MKQVSLVVIVIALLASVAVAQDIESTMAGRAQIGAGLISEAWLQNPAVLGLGATTNGAAGTGWSNSAVFMWELEGDADLRAVSWGGYPIGKRYGVGAGIMEVAGMDSVGLGLGWGSRDGKLAAGFNFQSVDAPQGDDLSVFDFAVGGRLLDVCPTFDRATWGIVVRDLTEEATTTYDLGVGFESATWRVAADLEDITDESDTILQVGASHRFGVERRWQGGVGLDDGDLTAGIVYHAPVTQANLDWKFGVAYLEADGGGEDAWVIGGGATWGP